MNRKLLTGCAALLVWHAVAAQESLKVWTLQTCLDYALENNIQLQQSRNDYLSGLEDTREAKAALLPSLAVSATQGYTNYPSSNAENNNSYTGTYGINAGLTLYEGGKLRIEKAGLMAYAHGTYFELGKKIGTFGFSVRKKKKVPRRK